MFYCETHRQIRSALCTQVLRFQRQSTVSPWPHRCFDHRCKRHRRTRCQYSFSFQLNSENCLVRFEKLWPRANLATGWPPSDCNLKVPEEQGIRNSAPRIRWRGPLSKSNWLPPSFIQLARSGMFPGLVFSLGTDHCNWLGSFCKR